MHAQLATRNVKIANESEETIMARVAFQKSAISKSNLNGYTNMVSEKGKSKTLSAGVNVGAKMIGVGVKGSREVKEMDMSDVTHSHEEAMDLMVSQFNEEGWITLRPHKTKSFAVQGQIAYISALRFDTKETIIHNWNSSSLYFLYDKQQNFEQKSKQDFDQEATESADDGTPSYQRMESQQPKIDPSAPVRDVTMENLHHMNILARVSFTKSRISYKILESYIKVAKQGGYDKDHQKDQRQYETAQAKFREEGWYYIKAGKDKLFTVQGHGNNSYFSVLSRDKVINHNWTSQHDHFIWDGEDFDTMDRWEKANKGGRKRMERHRDTKAKEAAAALKQAAKEDEKRRKEEAKAAKKLAKSRKNSSKQSSVEVVYTQPSDQPPPNTSGPVEPLQTDGTAQQLQNAMDDKTGDDGCTCCEMSGENECCEKYGKFIGGFVAAIVCLIVLIVVIVVVTGKEDTAKDLAN